MNVLDKILSDLEKAREAVSCMSYKSGETESDYEKGIRKGKVIAYNAAKAVVQMYMDTTTKEYGGLNK